MRRFRLSLLLALLLLVPGGCAAPDTIADFCGASEGVLTASVPVFADLGASCLRVKTLEQGIGTFAVVKSDSGCAAIDAQAKASVAAAKILEQYFGALHSLAKFGAAKPASDASTLAAGTAALAGSDTTAQTAIAAMAQFLTTATFSRHSTRSATSDMVQVNRNVAAVCDALITILQTNYVDQELADEERKLAVHYREFAVEHPEPQMVALLDERWQADRKALGARRTAARQAVAALEAVKAGVGALAARGDSLKAKEIPALLDPYIQRMQALLPEMQKAA